jgi:tetratricopeptide (TPR) repeat protein
LAVLGWRNAQEQVERVEQREAELKKAREDQRRQDAEAYVRLATEAIKRGDWKVALEASAEALKDNSGLVTDEVGMRLVRVKALVALNRLEEANKELGSLATRGELEKHEGSVRLWEADFRSERSGDTKEVLDLVDQARKKGLEESEEDYAAAWLAESVPEAIRHLHRALDRDPMNQRATAMLVAILFWTKDFRECRDLITRAEVFFSEDPTFKICHALLSARVGDGEGAAFWLEKSKGHLSEAQFATAKQMVALALQLDQLDRDLAKLATFDASGLAYRKIAADSLELSMKAWELGGSLRGKQGLTRDLMLGNAPPVVKRGMQRVGFLMLQLGLPQGFRGDSNRFLKDIADAILLYSDGLLYLMKGLLLEEKGRLAEAIESYQLGSITPSMVSGPFCRLTGLALLVLAQAEAAKRLAALPVLGSTTVGLMASPLGQGPLLAASAPTCGRTALAQAVQTLIERSGIFRGPRASFPIRP